MRWQSQALVALLATALIGCGPRDNAASDTGSSGAPGESPGMSSTPGTDTTSMGGAAGTAPGADTMADTGAAVSDSAKGNQSESGVTNTKTKETTTGPGVTKTRPDQGQPVTSKGDTVSRSDDSATTPPR
jgi:hypothetical protein